MSANMNNDNTDKDNIDVTERLPDEHSDEKISDEKIIENVKENPIKEPPVEEIPIEEIPIEEIPVPMQAVETPPYSQPSLQISMAATKANGELPYGTTGEILFEQEARDRITKISRRSFLWAGASLAATYAGWYWLVSNPEKNGALLPFRRAFEFNEKVARTLFSSARLAPTFPKSLDKEPIVNGLLGMRDKDQNVLDVDEDNWRIHVAGVYGKTAPLEVTMADIKALPRVEMVTEHKCVEGWSTIIHWAGARFVDFAAKYLPATTDGSVPDVLHNPEKLVRYVSMTTPDGDEYSESYYIGLDMESALHTQTLLCYEMNGQPLTAEHGAPLRLAMPLKYGIKCIKRIGKIAYTNAQPADYWAEQGYDWYAGL